MIHHGPANSLTVGRPVKFRDNAAACHDSDAIRRTQYLVEILADQDHRGAAVARRQQTLVHGEACAGVETAARAVGDHDRRIAAEFTGDDQLLRVAAGQKRRFLPGAAYALNVVVGDSRGGFALHRGAVQAAERAVAAGTDFGDGKIIGDGEPAGQRE